MNKFKSLMIAAATAAGAISMAGTAQAATVVCADSAAAVCSFDGSAGGWSNIKVDKKTTVAQAFSLLLNAPGTLSVTITSNYLDLVSLSFGGVTLTGITKGLTYQFAVIPSNTPQLLTVSMKNTKNAAYGYSSQLDFAAVPEPAAWGLMIGGFAMAGGALRRRRLARVAIA
ncbi:PEPxxWA-CTERM sorting domain-containing protein [Sphingomonas pituitosa]|uniref:PEPxxWA-CTERM sorting domain-containing protein n=1 Tax=Sphingomonas pituitosa TaxID=99597 RepID=UPI0008359825|nr:PEPxxWA-CTERM sorting domain-containing protein [Sphingomonas pituitosa]